MKALRILVVDDASFIRDLIKRSIKERFGGFQIDDAINGKKAMQAMQKYQYDLILCDWEMPEASGIEVLTWLRAREQEQGFQATPFIMVTSRGDKAFVVKAVQAGVNDYIGKPFTGDKLIEKIIKVLAKKYPELKGATGASPKGLFKDSANNLLNASGSADVLSAGSPSSKLVDKNLASKRQKSDKPKGKALLRTSASKFETLIRDINLKEVMLQVARTEQSPRVFDQVVVDISHPTEEGVVASMNASIISCAAYDGTATATSMKCKILWQDDDPAKLEILSKIIELIR